MALSKPSRIDWYVLIPGMYLTAVGLVIQTSIANKSTGVPLDLDVNTQIIAIVMAMLTVVVFYALRLLNKRFTGTLLYLLGVTLLLAVMAFGFEANGSQRWITLGSFQVQPTEIAKIGLIFLLARLFDNRDTTVNRVKTIATSLIVTVVPAALIILQPDLGSSVILFVVWITILFTSRLKLSRLALIATVITGAIVILIPFMAEYQQERLISYFNPERDASGSSYNVLQAGIAIGSGGLTGNGVDSGSQSQLNFLPSQHTDFVFAVTAEKLGLIGAMSVIVAFSFLLMRISYLAWWTTSQYERGILIGVVALIFSHVFVNIGMNLGLVPVTGLPLPLLSYGGTFTFVTIFCLGIVVVISRGIYSRAKSSI